MMTLELDTSTNDMIKTWDVLKHQGFEYECISDISPVSLREKIKTQRAYLTGKDAAFIRVGHTVRHSDQNLIVSKKEHDGMSMVFLTLNRK